LTASASSTQLHLSLFSTPARLRKPAFIVIDRMDGRVAPAEQLLGTAVALVAMAEATGTDIRSLIQIAERSMSDVNSCGAEHIRAIREYAAKEIGRTRR
jgi:hypothetical protein